MIDNKGTNTEVVQYLIIGNSAGGIGAAEAIRQVDRSGRITIVSEEPYPAYSRPMISDYLAGKASLERMLYRPPGFYDRHHITTLLGKRVTGIDVNARTVTAGPGDSIRWGKLLLAAGGTPIIPTMDGIDGEGVFTFTTFDDARAIDGFLRQHDGLLLKAAVIGGGLIGFSVTEALVRRGVSVTVIELKERVLNTIVDEETSALAEKALRGAGVRIITNHTVNKVTRDGNGHVTGVILDDQQTVPCDLVVVAIGVRPRLDLAAGAGIKINRGIVVDRHMMTSQPDVYACGDAAEAFDLVYGSNRVTPIWPNAYIGGRIAGFNMAGVPTEYSGGTVMNSLKYFGLAIASSGVTVPPDDTYEVVSSREDHIYRKVVLKDGVVMGMVFCNDVDRSGIVHGLMKDRIDVQPFKHSLVAADFNLACLPDALWRERLGTPASGFTQVAAKDRVEEQAGAD